MHYFPVQTLVLFVQHFALKYPVGNKSYCHLLYITVYLEEFSLFVMNLRNHFSPGNLFTRRRLCSSQGVGDGGLGFYIEFKIIIQANTLEKQADIVIMASVRPFVHSSLVLICNSPETADRTWMKLSKILC